MLSQLTSQFPANDFTLLAAVLLLPLIGAFVCGIFGKRLGKEGVRLMALSAVFGSFIASVVTFIMVAAAPHTATKAARLSWKAWHWFDVTGRGRSVVPIDVSFSVDALSATMMLVVTGVGFLIHLYSTGYMAKDEGFYRFFAYLNLFIFSMLVLILGDNLLVLFVGWEGVGLCSYLLIGFWYDDEKKAAAGKKAFITNRIGDFGLLVAMAMLVYYAGTLSWDGLEAAQSAMTEQRTVWSASYLRGMPDWLSSLLGPEQPVRMMVATMVALALFIGCIGKSAQIPLFVWLPDAMAGPTPVSALIHAATMVTAGIYLVCRTSFIFALSPLAMAVVAGTGALTALFAASIAFAQTDLKKVLAYSTVSQLGFMFIGVGVGAFAAGFFHVITHAFFKGCLFLCAGSVIHAMHARVHDEAGSQDMRNMGGLRKYMPITHVTFLVSCLAIAGFPLTSGFWSKDELLFKAFTNQIVPLNPNIITPPEWYGQMIYAIGIVAAVGTAFYMFRAYFMTFHGDFRGWSIVAGFKAPAHDEDHDDDHADHDEALEGGAPHESPRAMTVPLMILAFFALFGGFVYAEPLYHFTHIELFASLEHFWSPVFATASKFVTTRPGSEAMLVPLLAVGAGVSLFGIGAAYWVYIVQKGEPAKAFVARAGGLHRLVLDKWRIDELYDATILGLIDAMGDVAAQFDRWIVDGIFAKLTSGVVKITGHALRLLHTGRVQVYAASMVVGAAVIGWYVFTPHAEATIDARRIRPQGQVRFEAAAGHGYRYRWHIDGETVPDIFSGRRNFAMQLERCEQKTAVLTIKNAFDREAVRTYTQCRESKPGCCKTADPPAPKKEALLGGVNGGVR